jgi:hypothetical protein
VKEEGLNAKIKSPAQMEKVLGARRKHLIDDMYERPRRGTTLFRLDKTSLPEAKSKVQRHLAPTPTQLPDGWLAKELDALDEDKDSIWGRR